MRIDTFAIWEAEHPVPNEIVDDRPFALHAFKVQKPVLEVDVSLFHDDDRRVLAPELEELWHLRAEAVPPIVVWHAFAYLVFQKLVDVRHGIAPVHPAQVRV